MTLKCQEIDDLKGRLCQDIDDPDEQFWSIMPLSIRILKEALRWNKDSEKRQFQGFCKEKRL